MLADAVIALGLELVRTVLPRLRLELYRRVTDVDLLHVEAGLTAEELHDTIMSQSLNSLPLVD